MKENCRFCNIISNGIEVYEGIDKPFLVGKDYISLVSIGAFINGWTLIISKEHKYNLHKDYKQKKFYDYLKKHISYVKEKMRLNERIIVFEHGANKCNSETACGTSHAHLHVVPFENGIKKEIMSQKEWIECKWKNADKIIEEKEYLLYCDEPENELEATVYIHLVDVPESQYFRKVLFEKIGLKGSYSYKEDARLEESTKTQKMLEE